MCFLLEENSHELVSDPAEAQAIVINTCGFIKKAKEENIGAILTYAEMKKTNPRLKIVVSGCLTERYKKELLDLIPEIDGAIGVRDPLKLLETLGNNGPDGPSGLLDEGQQYKIEAIGGRRLYFSGLNYAYLKISEGCSRSCSFCAIPGIRGIQQSRTVEDIVKEAAVLSEAGVRELIIISEDTMSYGKDLYKKFSLITLLEELLKTGIPWIRLMYLYPDRELVKLAQFIASNERICNYIDMPLQHVNKSIISRMKRSGSSGDYLGLLKNIREASPGIRIRSSFITGYPGETQGDHEELMSFLREAALDRVGFFEYSDEENTSSFLEKNKVKAGVIKKRMGELAALQEIISLEKIGALEGSEMLCINDGQVIEENGIRHLLLRSEYDAPEIDGHIMVVSDSALMEKDFIRVRIKNPYNAHDLFAEVIG
jgi:ribosomal protein S12 methylthiotransferase